MGLTSRAWSLMIRNAASTGAEVPKRKPHCGQFTYHRMLDDKKYSEQRGAKHSPKGKT